MSTFEVIPGEVRIHMITHTSLGGDTHLYEVDADTKYYEAMWSSNEDGFELMFYAVSRTLKIDESLKGIPTRVRFTFSDEEYSAMAMPPGRYSFSMIFYRRDLDHTMIWSADDAS